MESFLNDYIEVYAKDAPEYVIDNIKECYRNLETIEDRNIFNSVIIVKRKKQFIEPDDIYLLFHLSVCGLPDKTTKMSYETFVKKYYVDDDKSIRNFATYMIDKLRPIDIKIALKD